MKKILTPWNLFRITLATIILGLIAGYCCARDFNDPSIAEETNQKEDITKVPPPRWSSSEIHHELQMQFCKVETHCRGWNMGITNPFSQEAVGWAGTPKCKQIAKCEDKASTSDQQLHPTDYTITKLERYFICTDNDQQCKKKKAVSKDEYDKW
jgi:hypothetical protein